MGNSIICLAILGMALEILNNGLYCGHKKDKDKRNGGPNRREGRDGFPPGQASLPIQCNGQAMSIFSIAVGEADHPRSGPINQGSSPTALPGEESTSMPRGRTW